jgi:hypothetical protein
VSLGATTGCREPGHQRKDPHQSTTLQVTVEWELLPPPTAGSTDLDTPAPDAASELTPPWLHVAPVAGALEPGEAAEIQLAVGVAAPGRFQLADPATAERLAVRVFATSTASF